MQYMNQYSENNQFSATKSINRENSTNNCYQQEKNSEIATLELGLWLNLWLSANSGDS